MATMNSDDNDNTAPEELTLSKVLSHLLEDDELKDVTLLGTDGVQVRANRCVLGSRSKVFRQMLFGGFSEAESPIVELGYKGSILQAIVEYIHTDSAHVLNLKKRKETENAIDRISSLVSLSAAGLYFNLSGLCKKCHDTMLKVTQQEPSLCFEFLVACRREGPSTPEIMSKLAWKTVRKKARNHIAAESIQCLDVATLEEILQDEKTQMTEAELFGLLHLWVLADPSERLTTGKGLLRHLALEKIAPSVLSKAVASSGLATVERLAEAYKQQALVAYEKMPESFDKPRKICTTAVTFHRGAVTYHRVRL